jgi:S1-C subfamily serine protease
MEAPMTRRALVTLAVLALAASVAAAPAPREPRLHPNDVSMLPSFVTRVEPSVVGLRVRASEQGASAARLGTRRFGSGLVFDTRGYAVTVSYLLLDAVAIEARGRDGRAVPARVVGIDFDTGLGVVKLEGAGPWPAAALGSSQGLAPGARTGTVGVDEDNDLVAVAGSVQAIQPFAAYWEYMLDRAVLVAPASPAWGGSALVNDRGEVVGIVSLRLGEAPHVNLAIPVEKFTGVRDELLATGRVVSRPPRPWLGLYTVEAHGAVVVSDFSPVGPAAGAGFRKGDRIVGVDGVSVGTQREFYEQLWARRAGDTIEVAVQRAGGVVVIAVRSMDRQRLFRAGD